MKEIAKIFYDFGFNIYGTKNQINENNFGDGNIMKAPSTKKKFNKRQTITEFNVIDWDNITGFGVFLGYDSLCAIDIDGVLDEKILDVICEKLSLPQNYQWIFKSGSQCGYHILFKCILPKNLEQTSTSSNSFQAPQDSIPHDFGTLDTNAYYPSAESYGKYTKFYKIEFIWKGNVVLPTSLHQSGNKYSFLHGIPDQQPISIEFKDLLNVKHFGSVQAKSSTFDLNQQTSYHLTFADSIPYNFESNIKESGLVFHISQYLVDNSYAQPLYMNQISWFVIDCNYNIIKRKCFNYYSSNIHGNLYCNTIDLNTSNKIIHNNRNIYHEFLFDLLHVKGILCWELENVYILKGEILKAGLYLDSFLTKITFGESSFDCDLFEKYINEEDFKPIVAIKDLLEDLKLLNVVDYFARDHKERLQRISNLEVKLTEFKHINSISYLTTFYTLFLIIIKNYSAKPTQLFEPIFRKSKIDE